MKVVFVAKQKRYWRVRFLYNGIEHLRCNSNFIPQLAPPFEGREISEQRLKGMLIGLAIGDALGNTSESMLPERRLSKFGWIETYLPNRYASGKKRGLPSDDTQMSFYLLEHLVDDKGLNAEKLAKIFVSREIFGMGRSVNEFRENIRAGVSWQEAGSRSAGNGALMRIAPIVGPHIKSPSKKLWLDAAICSSVTHNDPASIACCVAYIWLLSNLLVFDDWPDPEWWLTSFSDIAVPLEGNTRYKPRGGLRKGIYEGPISVFTINEVQKALEADLGTLDFNNLVYSGAYLMETMPCVLFILAKYGKDPERAILEAVNNTKDNDTIASIVGAAVGAYHSLEGLPEHLVKNLSGRLSTTDDNKIFELSEIASVTWLS